MLNPSDLYVSGGSNDLLVCWTDKVTKYDASSFYNWEQDNLPLHDLDERTHLLWEKLGHPTSSVGGFTFIVSADATDSCNPLVFTTLSACIAALPEVINYPILIEVASFGNLGGIDLSNKAFGPCGSIEINNRNSAFAFPRSLNTTLAQHTSYLQDGDITQYIYASSMVAGTGLFGFAAAGSLGSPVAVPIPSHDHINSYLYTRDNSGSAIYISSGTTIADRISDPRFRNPYVFVKRVDDRRSNRLTASLSSTVDPWNVTGTNYNNVSKFSFEPFEKNNSDLVYDVSTLNFLSNVEEAWGGRGSNNDALHAAMSFSYFNSLNYIKVIDCNGPIYIRNFNVDGQHAIDRGIEIRNSTVNLERTAVSRCNKAGLYAENSEVNVLRGIVAYRNYENTGGTRVGIPYADKRLSYKTLEHYGAGVYALNSTINFKDTYQRDIDKSIEASGSSHYSGYAAARLGAAAIAVYGNPNSNNYASGIIPNPSREAMTCFSRNDIGIHAVNSLITGGRTELNGSSNGTYAQWSDAYDLQSELNTEAGIRLDNSVLDYSGRVIVEGNHFGLDSTNSKVNIDSVAARYNQSTGLRLSNSKLIYNKNAYTNLIQTLPDLAVTGYNESQIYGLINGQDMLCDNSIVTPVYTSAMPSLYSMVFTSGSFGLEENSNELLPSIQLKGGSNVDLVHAHLVKDPSNKTTTHQYGLLSRLEGNSTLTFRGSEDYANVFIGPATREDSLNVAGIYASDGSQVKFQGPTAFARLGVDVLAEDNSTMEFTPHQSDNGTLLVSSFDLSNPANHTTVELHSTRACLVANRNSNIVMENLGDYNTFWLDGAYGSAIGAAYDLDTTNYSTYVSAGQMQFYPNANYSGIGAAENPTELVLTGTDAYNFRKTGGFYHFAHTYGNVMSAISTGGMCVRAVENSLVQANNVHFPTGWDNASSVVYDFYGNAPLPGPICTRLFIWNIADNSLLKGSYLTVSGLHPRDGGYWGPSGEWRDGADNVISAAPATTEDTSSISVLDYYGKSSENPFGATTIENYGPFRLYFSTDPVTNFMVASGTNKVDGLIRQVFAQGYNFSAGVMVSASTDFEPSAQYKSILLRDNAGNIQSSGFYYASAMVASPDVTKAVLDDSALNTFANAKHNTVGKSGLARVVQGYYPTKDFGGDSYGDYNYSHGVKSFNNFDLKKDN